jgi:hypothetical protein
VITEGVAAIAGGEVAIVEGVVAIAEAAAVIAEGDGAITEAEAVIAGHRGEQGHEPLDQDHGGLDDRQFAAAGVAMGAES